MGLLRGLELRVEHPAPNHRLQLTGTAREFMIRCSFGSPLAQTADKGALKRQAMLQNSLGTLEVVMSFEKFGNDLKKRRNIDVYITIVLASAVGFLGVFGIFDLPVVAAAILVTLGLLAVNMLSVRWENAEIRTTVSELIGRGGEIDRVIHPRYDFQVLRSSVRSSRTAFFGAFPFRARFGCWILHWRKL